MMRILITPPDITSDEPQRVRMTLDAGWDAVHMRHPEASTTDMRRLIEAIPQGYHSRLHLHGHFALTNEFNLGGLHLNGRCPAAPENYTGTLSATCHTVGEVAALAGSSRIAYVTLSPIFPSVSKSGYAPDAALTGSLHELAATAHPPVIALGGITPGTLPLLDLEIFQGYAVLGYLAQAADISDFARRLGEFK